MHFCVRGCKEIPLSFDLEVLLEINMINHVFEVLVFRCSPSVKFVVQDAIQWFHWNNSETTLHAFAVYYKESESTL